MGAAVKVIKVRNMFDNRFREQTRMDIEHLILMVTGAEAGDAISVRYEVGEKTTQYHIECPQAHIGRLIGAKGVTISAIRTIVAAALGVHGIRAIVTIPYHTPASED